MKRKDMNIDDILKRYMPHASQEDVDAAADTVLRRIREMRFQAEPAPAPARELTDGDWLHDFHVGLLMAVNELQGYADPVRITLKMEEILEEKVVWGTAVFLNLLLMERMGLVSSSPDPEKPEEKDWRSFVITQAGRETLAKALAFRQEAEVRARRPRFA
jgi:hypothetical protein